MIIIYGTIIALVLGMAILVALGYMGGRDPRDPP